MYGCNLTNHDIAPLTSTSVVTEQVTELVTEIEPVTEVVMVTEINEVTEEILTAGTVLDKVTEEVLTPGIVLDNRPPILENKEVEDDCITAALLGLDCLKHRQVNSNYKSF